MTITLSALQRQFSQSSFTKGKQYFDAGRVLWINEEDGEIQGYVSGSRRDPYLVSIVDEGEWLDTICSCPVGIDCKHAVAVLLNVIQDRQRSGGGQKAVKPKGAGPDPLKTWLAQFDKVRTPARLGATPSKHHQIYALEQTATGARVRVYKGYLKQNGQWSRLSPVTLDYHSLYHVNAHWQQSDVDIARLLMGLKEAGEFTLWGHAGGTALTAMLASQRLAYLGADKNLQLLTADKTCPLECHWRKENGQHSLALAVAGHRQFAIIATEPPFYLDTENYTLGKLDTPLDGQSLTLLTTLPPVPDSAMPEIAVRLRGHFTREQLPLPSEPDLIAVDTPIPHLTLVVCVSEQGVRYPGALLHWRYGEVDLPFSWQEPTAAMVTLEQNGRHYQITRNHGVELEYVHDLMTQGMGLTADFPPWQNAWITCDATGHGSIALWRHFERTTLPALAAQGWLIDQHPDYHLEIRPADTHITIRDTGNHWFDLALDFEVDGHRLDTTQLVAEWLRQGVGDTVLAPFEDGSWLEVDTAPLRPLRDLLLELFSQDKLKKPATLAPFQAARLVNAIGLNADRAPHTRKLLKALENFAGLDTIEPPKTLNATLRDYQKHGLNWLVFLRTYGFGGVLADDMGLGKTLQTLAFVLHLKETGQLKKPVLVVAPTSLMGNWCREADQFAPHLKVTRLHGPERGDLFKLIKKSDIVLTSYPLLLRDHSKYKNHQFSVLVLDEAQYVKNSQTKIAQQVRQIKAETRLCLTGTPLENHLGELWSLMDFALPGLLGNRDHFRAHFRNPIENDGDGERRTELAKRVAPFMLRRVKGDVAGELPAKTEIVHYIELEGGQRQLYESIRVTMEQRIRTLIAEKGFARSQIEFLDALLKLRQACIDPRLVKLDRAQNIREHAKLDWLAENLPQLLEEGRSILVFSQFTQALTLIEAKMNELKIPYAKLTGQTRKRDEAIKAFQNGEVRLFLISLKAGGSGLNLTAADVVIHVDPWWNPAVENQATDRAHRIGQDKPVFVYKLVAAKTVEEKIQQMQQDKQALADALFDETGAAGMPEDKESLLALLT